MFFVKWVFHVGGVSCSAVRLQYLDVLGQIYVPTTSGWEIKPMPLQAGSITMLRPKSHNFYVIHCVHTVRCSVYTIGTYFLLFIHPFALCIYLVYLCTNYTRVTKIWSTYWNVLSSVIMSSVIWLSCHLSVISQQLSRCDTVLRIVGHNSQNNILVCIL